MQTTAMIGQILIGLFFMVIAIYNFRNRTHFLESLKMKHVNIPMWALQAIVFLELLGGFLVLIGYAQTVAAIYLILLTLVISYVLHPFWKQKGHEAWKHLLIVMENLAVIGGLLLILSMRG